jgi:hypothetical protein
MRRPRTAHAHLWAIGAPDGPVIEDHRPLSEVAVDEIQMQIHALVEIAAGAVHVRRGEIVCRDERLHVTIRPIAV